MRITTFNPEIITNNAEPVVKLFQELGFEQKHKKTNVEDRNVTMIRMTDANGFHVDVIEDPCVTKDVTLMRMNVDHFGETYELLTDHGFRNIRLNENAVYSEKAKQARMISPSGFEIDLCHHIRNII